MHLYINIYITLTSLLEYLFFGCYTKDRYQWILFIEVFLTCDDFENIFASENIITCPFVSAYCKKKSDRELSPLI